MSWLARRKQRREVLSSGVTDEWRALLAEHCDWWVLLTDDERTRCEELIVHLLVNKRWEAAAGIVLDDEVRVFIAAQAARLGIGLDGDPFDAVRSVLVLPDDLRMTGEYEYVDGIVSDEDTYVSGLADPYGPVLISWEAVMDDLDYGGDGRNVVYHEFAHAIDQLDGDTDGIPPFATQQQRDDFVEVASVAYQLAVAGDGGESLDEYAGVNPAEFFAVATEAFFDGPLVLQTEHPALYDALRSFYRQDPASRISDSA